MSSPAWDALAEKLAHCDALKPYIIEKYGTEAEVRTITDAWNKALEEMLAAARVWADEPTVERTKHP